MINPCLLERTSFTEISFLKLLRKVPDIRQSTPVGISDFVHADAGTLFSVLLLAQAETGYKQWSIFLRPVRPAVTILSMSRGLHGLQPVVGIEG
jgi:hypothetical protein